MNAVKFKLDLLEPQSMIRYEVIYKNSLRDFRKFFTNEFHKTSDWPKSRDLKVIQNVLKTYTSSILSRDV